jgi:ATP-dependent Clp protease adaptor protein ClpS
VLPAAAGGFFVPSIEIYGAVNRGGGMLREHGRGGSGARRAAVDGKCPFPGAARYQYHAIVKPHDVPVGRTTMSDPEKRDGEGPNTGVIVKAKPKTKKPSMYKVLMLNDDYTPMEFVVHILERFFAKTREEATRIMLHVHRRGVGICGVFTYEVAETKVTQVMDFARQHQHPLQCTLEKE